jgi:CHRD domain
MLTSSIRTVGLTALFICLGAFNASARDRRFHANLTGFEETPAIIANGTGHLTLTLHDDGTMDFEMTYSGLTGPASASHIHIGQLGQAGGVTIFFCGGGGRPACPGASGTVSGTITAADVLPLPAQGLAAGDLAAVLRAMRVGATYANIHTAAHGGGEIRGQIQAGRGHDEEGEDEQN